MLGNERWRRRKAAHLVKLLALSPGHALHREQLIDLLWPELDPRAAVNSLHQALHVAREALGADARAKWYLSLKEEVLRLGAKGALWIDVDAFQAAAVAARRSGEPAAYQDALGLYGGELLPEDRYAEWAFARRETLHQEHLQLLLELAAIQERRRDFRTAILTLKQVVEIDPAHEEGHAGLMRLHALSGRRQQALRQYAALRRVLDQELSVQPGPETERLYREILTDRFPGSKGQHSQPVRSRASGNLPAALTSFVGRKRHLAEIKSLLAATRLVTLTGPGGCGKTRLALRAAGELALDFEDGVWLVELASLTDPALVPQATAAAMGVQDRPDTALEEALADHLKARHALIVLDNCEHLLHACARLAEGLLHAVPGVRILATSRESMHVPAEVSWPVPSLTLPPPDIPSEAGRFPAGQTQGSEAVQLFIDRARAVSPGLSLTDENAAAIARICRRLDGIPLALELAAARAKVLAVGQIAERLDDAVGLLSAGSRTAWSRQQTLKATLDWSHDLLSPDERCLFRRLAVFSGGCSVEAIEDVCSHVSGAAPGAFGMLARLVDKSLVQVQDYREIKRYRLLEPVRQYAEVLLSASGEESAVRDAHANWYANYVERAGTEVNGEEQAAWYALLEAEHDNLRSVLKRCLEGGDIDAGLQMASRLWHFWMMRGHFLEGLRWIEQLLGGKAGNPALRVEVLLGAAALAFRVGETERASSFGSEGLSLSERLADAGNASRAAYILGILAWMHGRESAAKRFFEQSLGFAQASKIPLAEAAAMNSMAFFAWCGGDYALAEDLLKSALRKLRDVDDDRAARSSFLNLAWTTAIKDEKGDWRMVLEETLAPFREVGRRSAIGYTLANLGALARSAGDLEKASTCLNEGVLLFRGVHDTAGIAQVLGQLGNLAAAKRDFPAACALLQECLALRRDLGDRRGVGRALGNLGMVRLAMGEKKRARALLNESLALFRGLGDKPGLEQILSNLATLEAAAGHFPRARQLLAECLAMNTSIGNPIVIARILFSMGITARDSGDREAARRYFMDCLGYYSTVGDRRIIGTINRHLEGLLEAPGKLLPSE